MKKNLIILNVLLFILANVQANPTITSASFVECEFSGQIKIELRVRTEGPLKSPLNFFIYLKGV